VQVTDGSTHSGEQIGASTIGSRYRSSTHSSWTIAWPSTRSWQCSLPSPTLWQWRQY